MREATRERAVVFECQGERLFSILSLPRSPRRRGVLVVVGGPQYRVGSHRQFTLLARALSAAGFACMRFDHRGMGDSSGDPRGFDAIEQDLNCAIDTFLREVPELAEIVLWGLCDAASAALMFGARHPRIAGLALLNPWVRSPATLAQARIRHYYAERLLSAELWSKLVRGEFDWRASAAFLLQTLRTALAGRAARDEASAGPTAAPPFQQRMAAGLLAFNGPTLLILSGNDLTAQEFLQHVKKDPRWQRALARPGVSRVQLPEADHTFSRQAWRSEVERMTLAWLDSW